MKLCINFDNDSDGENVDLDRNDLTFDVGSVRLEPEKIEGGHIATYDAPDDLDLAHLDETLDDFVWSYNGYSIIDETPAPDGF